MGKGMGGNGYGRRGEIKQENKNKRACRSASKSIQIYFEISHLLMGYLSLAFLQNRHWSNK